MDPLNSEGHFPSVMIWLHKCVSCAIILLSSSMTLISSIFRSSEPGALLLLICLIVLVTSAGRTAGLLQYLVSRAIHRGLSDLSHTVILCSPSVFLCTYIRLNTWITLHWCTVTLVIMLCHVVGLYVVIPVIPSELFFVWRMLSLVRY